jgi:hypothetical protein
MPPQQTRLHPLQALARCLALQRLMQNHGPLLCRIVSGRRLLSHLYSTLLISPGNAFLSAICFLPLCMTALLLCTSRQRRSKSGQKPR